MSPEAPPAAFVVRTGECWWWTVAGGEVPEAVTVDRILERIALMPPSDPPVGVPTVDALALDPSQRVEPSWTWVGRVVRDGVLAGAGDVVVAMDAADLRMVDAIRVPVDVASLQPFADDSEARVGRLVIAGVLAIAAEAEVDAVADADAHSESAPDAGTERVDERAAAAALPPSSRRGDVVDRLARSGALALDRVSTAYRLSSKLAPLREAVASIRGRPSAGDDDGPVAAPPAPAVRRRVPVHAVWHREVGPLLSLGTLTASARHHDGGALNEHYDIGRPTASDEVWDDLAAGGPAVVLVSHYVWSVAADLDFIRRAVAANAELVVVVGGPSAPKYREDAERFLERNPGVTLLVRGEGEEAICEILAALRPPSTPPGMIVVDPDALGRIGGVTLRDATGTVVRAPDRDRIADLDALPSPYLTGEFDHLHRDEFTFGLPLETNRGCPYACTFCDWGSSTMSRVRHFDLDRVRREIEWMADREIAMLMVADANFGMFRRDVEIAEHLVEVHRRTGYPHHLAISPAKNTIRHLVAINDTLVKGGIVPTFSIALQTVDPDVLRIIARENIAVDAYLDLAADYRRRGLPLMGDVLLGLPGQTYDTYRTDLQFNLDHEILPRSWIVQVLPNSPMNEASYREQHGIEVDDRNAVVATASFDRADRARMMRLRRADITLETFGLARHVARWLQWDHGVPAIDLFDAMLEAAGRYAAMGWVVGYFDIFTAPPGGWDWFYDDLRRLLVTEMGIPPSTAMDAVFAAQRHLMPARGREFPATVRLPHDYAAYHRDATASLYTSGRAGRPPAPLQDYSPGELTVTADPLGLCDHGPRLGGDSRDEVMQGDFYTGTAAAYELVSPLARLLPRTVAEFGPDVVAGLVGRYRPEIDRYLVDVELAPPPGPPSARVSLVAKERVAARRSGSAGNGAAGSVDGPSTDG